MSQANHDDLGTIEQQLRTYFARRPQAADTAEGIRQWWLPDGYQRWTLPQVEAALRRMLESNELVCTANASGDVIYAKRHDRNDLDR